ncbi:MAG TPA: hypothetical protein VIH04_07895 [Nitrosarchaeum sp.]
MTSVNVNNFVSRTDPEFLLLDGEGYEVKFKQLDNKNVASFHLGHTQFMEIVTKYGLKPKWQIWENATDKEGNVIPNKGKYVDSKGS